MAAACRERLTHRKWKSAWPRRPAANPQAPPEPGAAASAHAPMSSPSKAQAADVHYRIAPADLHAHLFTVALTVARPAAGQELSLPVWIPGSYLIREFSRNLQALKARQGRHEGALTPLDKHRWQTVGSDLWRVRLRPLGAQRMAGCRPRFLQRQQPVPSGAWPGKAAPYIGHRPPLRHRTMVGGHGARSHCHRPPGLWPVRGRRL